MTIFRSDRTQPHCPKARPLAQCGLFALTGARRNGCEPRYHSTIELNALVLLYFSMPIQLFIFLAKANNMTLPKPSKIRTPIGSAMGKNCNPNHLEMQAWFGTKSQQVEWANNNKIDFYGHEVHLPRYMLSLSDE
jgi:hypothetical protein